mmetsp:Transcript_138376/g.345316  ORF Transcript_138376/g.345316 Transcript_138376/m.345316 type:complete len:201 (-) Transcript_138376:27-629(-)
MVVDCGVTTLRLPKSFHKIRLTMQPQVRVLFIQVQDALQTVARNPTGSDLQRLYDRFHWGVGWIVPSQEPDEGQKSANADAACICSGECCTLPQQWYKQEVQGEASSQEGRDGPCSVDDHEEILGSLALATFPKAGSLGSSPLNEILQVWQLLAQGLSYNTGDHASESPTACQPELIGHSNNKAVEPDGESREGKGVDKC